jgi:hypothetical protein
LLERARALSHGNRDAKSPAWRPGSSVRATTGRGTCRVRAPAARTRLALYGLPAGRHEKRRAGATCQRPDKALPRERSQLTRAEVRRWPRRPRTKPEPTGPLVPDGRASRGRPPSLTPASAPGKAGVRIAAAGARADRPWQASRWHGRRCPLSVPRRAQVMSDLRWRLEPREAGPRESRGGSDAWLASRFGSGSLWRACGLRALPDAFDAKGRRAGASAFSGGLVVRAVRPRPGMLVASPIHGYDHARVARHRSAHPVADLGDHVDRLARVGVFGTTKEVLAADGRVRSRIGRGEDGCPSVVHRFRWLRLASVSSRASRLGPRR